jgi:WD40 repeat protein/serine/threonine protein kinase
MSATDHSGNDLGAEIPTHLMPQVERFEGAWERGERPAIADYLPPGGPERRAVLVHLLHVDLERRLKADELVRVEAYLADYPELAKEAGVVLDLLRTEYALRRAREPRLGLADYLRRFPQHATALRERLSGGPDGVCAAEASADAGAQTHHRAAAVTQAEDREPVTLPPRSMNEAESQHEARTVPPLPAPAAGDVPGLPEVPGYELLAELGRGGMGVVYQARQTALDRVVALKMILAGGHAGEHDLARFRTEAEAVARLRHPNVVQIHEVGQQNGLPYFSLEFCEGGSLEKKLAGTPLPPREAARLVETLARAMEAAHQKGIIHRDLKPANVLLAEDGSPKITDFGLAKKLEEGAGQTGTGDVLGTPSYMAPEQAGGRARQVGTLADVYDLGAILYECLTGRPPFKAATVMDTLLQVLSEEPVPVQHLQPKVPRDLETITLKCLQKEPGKRYATAADLADDLRRFQAGKPVVARPVGRLERGWRWCRRNPAVAASLAVVALALCGGAGVATWQAVEARAQAGRAEEALADRNTALGEARASAEEQKQARQAEQQAREAAQRQEQLANQRLRKSEWLVYAAQIGLAQREWQDGNVGHARDLLDACQWNLRGWEHRYLCTLFNSNQHTFRGHTAEVHSVAFSPDGKHLATASADQSVKVWDAASGQETLTLKGHTKEVLSVAFSPDGKRLASGSWDGTVKVWDAATGQETLSLQGHTAEVYSVAFSPDGNRLASASYDRTVRIWDAQTGQETLSLKGHSDQVKSVTFSRDGQRLASASRDGTVKVWDAGTGLETLSLKGASAAVAFSPDGTRLAGGDDTVQVWEAATGQETFTLRGHTGALTSVAFSPDSKRLASASQDHTVKVWDTATGQETLSLKGHTGLVSSVAFSPDGKRLASASHDRTVRVWDAATGQEILSLKGYTSDVYSVVFSPDGKRLASCGHGTVKVWDAATGQQTLAPKWHTGALESVAFSPDGTCLVSPSLDGTVKVWDAATGQERFTFEIHRGAVYHVAFSPDGKRLASASSDETVKVSNPATGEATLTLRGHTGWVTSVAFSPDGKRLVSGGDDHTVKLWNAETGQQILTLKGHTGSVTSVAFSPDGKRLASASDDKTVKVWEAATGQLSRSQE